MGVTAEGIVAAEVRLALRDQIECQGVWEDCRRIVSKCMRWSNMALDSRKWGIEVNARATSCHFN
jgi:hypothetical protein